MKNKKILFFTLILFTGITIFASCKSGVKNNEETKNMEASNKMMNAMNSMTSASNSMQMINDFDVDFAQMMIIHHQAAIDMAEIEVMSGSDDKIKSLAQQIITSQKAEQEKLRAFSNGHIPEQDSGIANPPAGGNAMMAAMMEMDNKMKNITISGDVDKDFVMMMIPHHEGAISMAESEIANGHENEIKQMAQKMISAQSSEINEMQMWVDKHK